MGGRCPHRDLVHIDSPDFGDSWHCPECLAWLPGPVMREWSDRFGYTGKYRLAMQIATLRHLVG